MSQTLLLFDVEQSLPTRAKFHGETYDHELDYDRLNAQQKRVFEFMDDGEWHSLAEIRIHTMYAKPPYGDPEPSISARLRDFRRLGWVVEKKRWGVNPASGLWLYRLVREKGNPRA